MSKVDEKFEIELNAMKYNVHANSPYNDGWTQDHYRKLYEEELKKQNVETSNPIIKNSLEQQINEKKIEKQQIIREIGPLQENQRKMYMKQRRPNAKTTGGSQKKQKGTRNKRNKSNKK